MKNRIIITAIIGLICIRCSDLTVPKTDIETVTIIDITGSWKLISTQTIINNDTTHIDYTKHIDGIKIIGKDHFAFFQHDLTKGQNSTSARFSSGGGKYILQGNHYTEFLEYCSSRKWEGNKFDFTVVTRNDSLIQTGIEKIESLNVDRIITETYVRINDSNSPIAVINDFEVNASEWLENKGNSSISGVAKFKSKSGEIRFGSDFRIELMPLTEYTEERLSKIYNNKTSGDIHIGNGVPRFIPDLSEYHNTRKTTCDKNGTFEFYNLPNGAYYLIAFMIWDVENSETNFEKDGGGIMRRILLQENESSSIEMVNF